MSTVDAFGGPNCLHGEYELANRSVYAEFARGNDEERRAWIADSRNAGRWRLKANPAPMTAPAGDIVVPPTNALATDEALAFLDDFHGDSPRMVVSIKKPAAPTARTFAATDRNGTAKFIAQEQAAGNDMYFLIGCTTAPMSKKPAKDDMACTGWVQLDLDPRARESLEEERRRMLASLTTDLPQGVPPPNRIIDSGRGYWGFWKLDQQHKLDGKGGRLTEEVESRARGLARAFGDRFADGCHNCDRIARLPGTVNHKTGERARVLHQHSHNVPVSLAQLPKAETDRPKESTTVALAGATVAPKGDGIRSLDDLKRRGVPEDIIELIRTGPTSAVGRDGQPLGRGGIDYKVTSALVRAGLSDTDIKLAYRLGRISADASDWPRGFDGEMARIIERVRAEVGPVVSDTDHMARARVILHATRPNLKTYREDYHDFDGGRYCIVSEETIKAEHYRVLERCSKQVKIGKVVTLAPFHPNIKSVSEGLTATKALTHIPPETNQPLWLDGRRTPDPADLISFPNGILNLATDEFSAPDPMLFTASAARFDYDQKAVEPVQFITFLKEVFAGEQDQIDALQEFFGYCLSGDVSQEKAFMLVGDKRSGKDTLRNVLQSLLPDGAICGPTLDSMGTNFGMSQFIGKSLAVVGDMRIGTKCDKDLLAENVLKLTGRGLFTIDRKHQSHWTGSLPCKLLLISNERPSLKDTSGALASRFIVFRTRTSFYGREDPNLFRERLAPELPGIMLWALAGLRRMRARGRLTEPACSVEEREQLAREGSPMLAFVQECLTLDPRAEEPKDKLHAAYNTWAVASGLFAKSKSVFFRDLQTATGGRVAVKRGRTEDGGREQLIVGARLNEGRTTQRGAQDDQIPF